MLVQKSLMKYFYFPLINKTEARVYPFETSYAVNFIMDTNEASSKVLLITDSNGNKYRYRGNVRFLQTHKFYEVSDEDLSAITGLPNEFHEGEEDLVQVIELRNPGRMVDAETLDKFDWDVMKLSVEEVEIDESNKAHITVSLTDKTKLYYNDDEELLLSYHLDYEESDEDDKYDNGRTEIGPVVFADYTYDFNLSELDENLTVVIDVVQEHVEWYSWRYSVPVITFNMGNEGWEYSIEYKTMGKKH